MLVPCIIVFFAFLSVKLCVVHCVLLVGDFVSNWLLLFHAARSGRLWVLSVRDFTSFLYLLLREVVDFEFYQNSSQFDFCCFILREVGEFDSIHSCGFILRLYVTSSRRLWVYPNLSYLTFVVLHCERS